MKYTFFLFLLLSWGLSAQNPTLENLLSQERNRQTLPLQLLQGVNDASQKAQQALAEAAELQSFFYENKDPQKPYRCEIFGIYPQTRATIPPQMQGDCPEGSCYRVEVYQYTLNQSLSALVNTSGERGRIVAVNQVPFTQPDIPRRLQALAVEIARNSPEVIKALGYSPDSAQALMSATKTALNRSRCERSQHLCVAPTFVVGEKALWAIVDLTELRLVGVRWTNTGKAQQFPELQTERKLQNATINECFCEKETHQERGKWAFDYALTASDGLQIRDLKYQNEVVISSAKLVDWHVSYSRTDAFGYSDAIGCPSFSSAAVLAIEPPQINPLIENGKEVGFSLQQNFFSEGWPRPCNYNYAQRFDFYDDGRFQMSAASLGRGCGNDGTYRPVSRLAFPKPHTTFAQKSEKEANNGQEWQDIAQEKYIFQNALSPTLYRLATPDNKGYEIQTQTGSSQNAYLYVTKRSLQKDEGESDLVTIGPCCNTDYRQGPEKFLESENLQDNAEGLVLWYVPELKNDDRTGSQTCWAEAYLENGTYKNRIFPCWSGLMFRPF